MADALNGTELVVSGRFLTKTFRVIATTEQAGYALELSPHAVVEDWLAVSPDHLYDNLFKWQRDIADATYAKTVGGARKAARFVEKRTLHLEPEPLAVEGPDDFDHFAKGTPNRRAHLSERRDIQEIADEGLDERCLKTAKCGLLSVHLKSARCGV